MVYRGSAYGGNTYADAYNMHQVSHMDYGLLSLIVYGYKVYFSSIVSEIVNKK